MSMNVTPHEPSVHLCWLWCADRTVGEALPPEEGARALFKLPGSIGNNLVCGTGKGWGSWQETTASTMIHALFQRNLKP